MKLPETIDYWAKMQDPDTAAEQAAVALAREVQRLQREAITKGAAVIGDLPGPWTHGHCGIVLGEDTDHEGNRGHLVQFAHGVSILDSDELIVLPDVLVALLRNGSILMEHDEGYHESSAWCEGSKQWIEQTRVLARGHLSRPVPTQVIERRDYTLTAEQYDALLEACRPVPYMVVGGTVPSSPRENANRAWQQLGQEMGFDWKTVERGRTPQQFSAVPTA